MSKEPTTRGGQKKAKPPIPETSETTPAGGKVQMKAIKFSAEELALLNRVKGDDRSITETVMDGLRCLEANQGEMSNEFLIYELRKRLKNSGGKKN